MLASPSAASGFVHQVELDVPVAIYTIGPSTTAAARALGLDVDGRGARAEPGRNFGGNAMNDDSPPRRGTATLGITTPGRTRLRRLRRTRALRDLVAETHVTAEQLIMPHFVVPAARADEPISSMPGIAQQGIETVVKTIGKDLELGIRAVLLFGHPEHGGKTPDGRAAAAANGAVQRACERLKKASSATRSS